MADLFSGASAQITPFSFNTHSVRVVLRDGNPWFVAKDVCDTLGYSNSRSAVADHLDEDERSTVANPDGRNGGGVLTIINESGLYALVLRSRKPEARKFAKWVTGEVLPSIRKTGQYTAPQAPAAPKTPAGHIQVNATHLSNLYADLRVMAEQAEVLAQNIQNAQRRINGLGLLESDLPPSWWDKYRLVKT